MREMSSETRCAPRKRFLRPAEARPVAAPRSRTRAGSTTRGCNRSNRPSRVTACTKSAESKLAAAMSERRRTSRRFNVGRLFASCFTSCASRRVEADKAITLFAAYRRESVLTLCIPIARNCWACSAHESAIRRPALRFGQYDGSTMPSCRCVAPFAEHGQAITTNASAVGASAIFPGMKTPARGAHGRSTSRCPPVCIAPAARFVPRPLR